jgi:hypothetical protein
MYSLGKILVGLGIFGGLVSAPVWYGLAKGSKGTPPELELPTNAKECIESTAFMKAKHMELLDQWRDAAVRRSERVYVSSDGHHYEISLTGTCLRCHSDPAKFCDRCHAYAGVDVFCWDCHLNKKRG